VTHSSFIEKVVGEVFDDFKPKIFLPKYFQTLGKSLGLHSADIKIPLDGFGQLIDR
jgi:hypothetical protein